MFKQGRVSIVSMFAFSETDITERQKYKKRIKTAVDNIVNDLRYERKFENCVKDKNNFFITRKISFFLKNKNIFYSWRHIFLRFSSI